MFLRENVQQTTHSFNYPRQILKALAVLGPLLQIVRDFKWCPVIDD